MRTLKTTLIALVTAVPTLTFSISSQAAMDPYVRTALIDVCKAAMSNRIHRLNDTSKSYNLKKETIALNVMCNGEDIISFAESRGATKTAAKLQKSIGNVQIIDTANTEKSNVNFAE